VDPFAYRAEPLAGRGEDRDARRAAEHVLGEGRREFCDMLAIIEDDENVCVPFAIGARSTKATASKAALRRSATATATVVLPMPPGGVSPLNSSRLLVVRKSSSPWQPKQPCAASYHW
jgi:hypothetical protein